MADEHNSATPLEGQKPHSGGPREAPRTSQDGHGDRLMPVDLGAAARVLGKQPSECPLCGNAQQQQLFRSDGKVFWICAGCELVYVHDIYPEFVIPPAVKPAAEELLSTPPRRRRKFNQWLRAMLSYRELNRFLDLGCGQGEFLQFARQAGWRVQGLDVDPLRAALARNQRNLEVFEGELHQAQFEAESFDVVFMSEVIEHIIDPISLMKEIRRILRPGGIAFVRTGNARSWSARLRGAAWDYYRFCFHGHIRYFSPSSAQALSKAAGFASVESQTHGFAFMESGELYRKWYKLPVKFGQGLLSPLVGPLGGGHRLRMIFHR